MDKFQIAILMGSQSDLPTFEEAARVLKEFGVSCEMRVLSAHRTPDETAQYVKELKSRGVKVVIAGAGGSAALSGVVAAHTILPVIGIPIETAPFHGLDSLLSTVQMPPGVPVACVSVGKWGAKNAALLALRILSLSDKTLEKKLEKYREDEKEKILKIKL
jgi:phosphoribosylaminoimidazole carboxylase PurE protein